MPTEALKLANLMREWNFPHSAFGFGKHPTEFLKNYSVNEGYEEKSSTSKKWLNL